MHFFRSVGPSIAAIIVLIGLSVLAVVSFGEGFKFLATRKESVSLRKRDGSTITFSLPWKSPLGTTPKAKEISPVLSGSLGDVTNIASTILDNGYDAVNRIQSTSMADVSTAAVSVVLGGLDVVASILSEFNSIVNHATGVIGSVVGDATSAAIVGGSTSGLNITNCSTVNPSDATASSKPQEFLPQSNSSMPTSAFPHNITSLASLPLTLTLTAGSSCPSTTITTSTVTPCCPDPTTVTRTATETWHSTHYETTATLYSFMSAFTLTFTETFSVCPISNPYLFAPNATVQAASLTRIMNISSPCSPTLSTFTHPCPNSGYPCSECSDGFFCPPPQTSAQNCPCGLGWACAACSQTFFCPSSSLSVNPTPTIASFMSSLIANATSSSVICPNGRLVRRQQDCSAASPSVPTTVASFAASLPSLSKTLFSIPTSAATNLSSIICADGSVVVGTQDCLNGLVSSASCSSSPSSSIHPITSILSTTLCADGSLVLRTQDCLEGATSSSLLSFKIPSVPNSNQIPTTMANVSKIGPSIPSSAIANVASVFGNMQGLTTGDLLSTVLSDATSALYGISSATSIIGNALTSGGPLTVLESGGAAAITLPTETGAPTTVAGPIAIVAGNTPGTLLKAINTLASNSIASSGYSVADSEIGNVIDYVGTVINGISTTLPAVTTVLNGIPTKVPVLDMLVNGVVTAVPVVNGVGLLGGLGTGARQVVKERRRGVNRIEGIVAEVEMGDVAHCEFAGDEEEGTCL